MVNPLILLVGLAGVTIDAPPGPPTWVHSPVPMLGELPASTALLTPQRFTGVVVTVATVAVAEAVMVTVSRVAVHPDVFRLHSNL